MVLPLNMRAEVNRYERLIEEIPRINSLTGPYYMAELLKAKELCSALYCQAIYEYERAKHEVRTQAAIAYIERSEDYLKNRSIKVTEEAKKHYINIDAAYAQAKTLEDYYRALTTFLGNKVDKFQSAHDDAKKIFDASRDPRGSLPGLPSGKDGQ